MSKRSVGAWWSSLRFGRRPIDDGDDFGDMGTAFGMEASLGLAHLEALQGGTVRDLEAPASAADRRGKPSTY